MRGFKDIILGPYTRTDAFKNCNFARSARQKRAFGLAEQNT